LADRKSVFNADSLYAFSYIIAEMKCQEWIFQKFITIS